MLLHVGGPERSVFLICCLAGAGGVGKRGVFWIGWGNVCDGTVLCTGFWQLSVIGWRLFMLWLMTIDGLGSGVGHIFEHCVHGVGGYLLYLPCCGVDWKWILGCIDNPWGNVHPPTGVLNWWLNVCLTLTIHHLHHMWLCKDVGVAQLIHYVNALVCMVLLFHSQTDILCCWWCACTGGGMWHLFLQLLAFTRHDWLLSRSLLGDLLHSWLLSPHLGFLLMQGLSEGAVLIYSLVPGVWHLVFASIL